MEFLFDNPLANVPGVIFLIFYALYAVFALVIFGVWKAAIDKTDQLAMPPIPPKIDPYEIAFLRGGINEMARFAAFSLRQKGFLIFQNDGKKSYIHRDQHQNNPKNLPQVEQAALSWFSISREPKELFGHGGLTEILKPFIQTYEANLEQQQFLTDRHTKSRISKARLILLTAILGLGGYKFAAAWLNGYNNVIGIFIIGALATFFAFRISVSPRLTKLGKVYLERLQLAFSQLKTKAQTVYQTAGNQPQAVSGATFAGVDPMLLGVGIFGTTILAGTMYEDYNTAFQRAQQASGSSGCSSACGSSCSTGSGGGSSSCGGGCGGCGGGCS